MAEHDTLHAVGVIAVINKKNKGKFVLIFEGGDNIFDTKCYRFYFGYVLKTGIRPANSYLMKHQR